MYKYINPYAQKKIYIYICILTYMNICLNVQYIQLCITRSDVIILLLYLHIFTYATCNLLSSTLEYLDGTSSTTKIHITVSLSVTV